MNVTKPGGSYAVETQDTWIYYDSGSYDVKLPPAKGSGRQLYIVNMGAGTITITTQLNDRINGNTSLALGEKESAHIIDLILQKWVSI